MKIINLSTILLISLFTSVSSVWAMDNTEEKGTPTPQVLPKFPLKEAGERIAAQGYSITGEDIKHLITASAEKRAAPLTDKKTYLGSGVWATNLSDYEKIENKNVYTMTVQTYQVSTEEIHGWKATGIISGTQKEFLLYIDSNYNPFQFGYPRVY